LLTEWDYERNEKNPTEYAPYGSVKVWWKCSQGHKWEARIAKRAMGRGCPFCSGNKVSKDKSLTVKYPKLVKEWVSEKTSLLHLITRLCQLLVLVVIARIWRIGAVDM